MSRHALVFGLSQQLVQGLSSQVFVLQLTQAVTLFVQESAVGQVCLPYLLVHVAAALRVLRPVLRHLLVLKLVDVAVLGRHGDVLADFVVVLDGVQLISHKLLLDFCQILLVKYFLHCALSQFTIRLLFHLHFQVRAHLKSLRLQSCLLLRILLRPLPIVVLDGFIPLCVGHSDHFPVVRVLDLLVDVIEQHVVVRGFVLLLWLRLHNAWHDRPLALHRDCIVLRFGNRGGGFLLHSLLAGIAVFVDQIFDASVEFVQVALRHCGVLLDELLDLFADAGVQVTLCRHFDVVSVAELIQQQLR